MKKAKALTHEQVHAIVGILNLVNQQSNKDPVSKATMVKILDTTSPVLTKVTGAIERRGWFERRNGPAKEIYFKMTAKGKAVIKAWDLLYN